METTQLYRSELNNLHIFREAIILLCKSVDEAVISCEEHDIIIKGMDASRIIMFRLKLMGILSSSFNANFFLNIDDLTKILNRIQGDSLVIKKTIKTTFVREKEVLKESLSMEAINGIFTLYLLEVYSLKEELIFTNIEKIDYAAKHEFTQEILSEIIKSARVYSDIVLMRYDKEGMEFYADGQQGTYTLNKGMIKKQGEAMYSLTFLNSLFVGSEGFFHDHPVVLHIKMDNPLHIEYKDSIVEYDEWIAPRVEEADDDWEDDEF